MFTGITQSVGKLETIDRQNEQELRLKITTTNDYFTDCKLGDSIMVDGACLTIVNLSSKTAVFDVMVPTFNSTVIRHYKIGQEINLEKAIRATNKFDGHFVLGHVDGTAQVTNKQLIEKTVFLTFQPNDLKLMNQIVDKGSITISGVSLTIISTTKSTFQVGLIPLTLAETNLVHLKLNSMVNIETDILAKYVKKEVKI